MQANGLLNNYIVDARTWDEMYSDSTVREQYRGAVDFLQQLSIEELSRKEELAKRLFMSQGITFTVYSSGEGIEKIFPFDIIPRIITAAEWSFIESGIKQRLKALNLFLKDVYNDQFIIKDGIVPIDMIYSCPHFLREMHNFPVPYDIYVHIAGIDLIREQRWHFLYPGRQPAHTQRRKLYAGEPGNHQTHISRPDSQKQCAAGNGIPYHPAQKPGFIIATANHQPYYCCTDTRHL